MIHIKLLTHRAILSCILLIFAFSMLSHAERIQKDDIEITVDLKIDQSGKKLIRCVLSNRSQHTIATANLHTPSSAFYFKLLDQSGKEIMQNPEWANEFAQKSSRRYTRPKSSRSDQIYPGGTKSFEFYLEDAYGLESLKGKEMIVSWESRFIDKVLVTSDHIDAEGKLVKGTNEKYMFPSRWEISATLSLDDGSVKRTELPIEKTEPKAIPEAEMLPKHKEETKAESSTVELAKDPIPKIVTPKNNSPSKWWILLVFSLVTAVTALVMKKKNKNS